jgi:hypothetical protein
MAQLPFCVVPLPLGTVATGNERAEGPAYLLGEFKHIGMVWRSSGNGNLWVRGDFGVAKAIDFCSLIHANAQPGTTIRLRLGDSQAHVDGSAPYDSGTLPLISPSISREDGLYSSHLELTALQTRRWWRIDIGGHTGDFEASKLVLGQRITPSTYYSSGFEFGTDDLGSLSFTQWGVPDETDGRIFRSLRFTLAWLNETEFETKFRPLLERIGRRGVSFWCFDPTANTYRQQRSYMGTLKDNPYAAVGGAAVGKHSIQFSILSMI